MFQPELLAGRIILITGGGTGLGRGIAEAVVAHGGKVALIGRRLDILKAAAAELGEECALPVRCDVRFADEVDGALATVLKHYGHVDALINNAAGNFVFPTNRLTPNSFKIIIDTVLMGAIHFSLAMGKHWIAKGDGGSVICITANYASSGSPFVVPSACAKAGVENLIRSLAAEWGQYRVRFLGISPGPFPTEGAMRQLRISEDLMDGVDIKSFATRRIPWGRFGKVEELANLALYLLSPMAEYINGDIIRIDGGELPNLAGEFSFMHNVRNSHWEGDASHLKRT